jgi:cobalt-zinc-cadmium efflux system protein
MHDSRVDQLLRYKTAASINLFVWVLQIVTVLFIADSLALFGDAAHSLSDILILGGTIFVLRRQIYNPSHDHRNAKTWLVRMAVGMLWLSALYIVIEAVGRIRSPVIFPGAPVAILALLSAIGNLWAHRVIEKVDKALHDHVHKANVAHLLTDFALSFVVFASAILNMTFGWVSVDAWISLLVIAPWMLWWGWRIIHPKTSLHQHGDHDNDHH